MNRAGAVRVPRQGLKLAQPEVKSDQTGGEGGAETSPGALGSDEEILSVVVTAAALPMWLTCRT